MKKSIILVLLVMTTFYSYSTSADTVDDCYANNTSMYDIAKCLETGNLGTVLGFNGTDFAPTTFTVWMSDGGSDTGISADHDDQDVDVAFEYSTSHWCFQNINGVSICPEKNLDITPTENGATHHLQLAAVAHCDGATVTVPGMDEVTLTSKGDSTVIVPRYSALIRNMNTTLTGTNKEVAAQNVVYSINCPLVSEANMRTFLAQTEASDNLPIGSVSSLSSVKDTLGMFELRNLTTSQVFQANSCANSNNDNGCVCSGGICLGTGKTIFAIVISGSFPYTTSEYTNMLAAFYNNNDGGVDLSGHDETGIRNNFAQQAANLKASINNIVSDSASNQDLDDATFNSFQSEMANNGLIPAFKVDTAQKRIHARHIRHDGGSVSSGTVGSVTRGGANKAFVYKVAADQALQEKFNNWFTASGKSNNKSNPRVRVRSDSGAGYEAEQTALQFGTAMEGGAGPGSAITPEQKVDPVFLGSQAGYEYLTGANDNRYDTNNTSHAFQLDDPMYDFDMEPTNYMDQTEKAKFVSDNPGSNWDAEKEGIANQMEADRAAALAGGN